MRTDMVVVAVAQDDDVPHRAIRVERLSAVIVYWYCLDELA